jgi:hypothetical protein
MMNVSIQNIIIFKIPQNSFIVLRDKQKSCCKLCAVPHLNCFHSIVYVFPQLHCISVNTVVQVDIWSDVLVQVSKSMSDADNSVRRSSRLKSGRSVLGELTNKNSEGAESSSRNAKKPVSI